MSNSDIITLKQFLLKTPRFFKIARAVGKNRELVKQTRKPDTPLGYGKVLEKAVAMNPNGPAILFEDRRITYQEFNDWSNRLAHYFMSQGIKKGDAVAVFIENRPELLACVAALSKIGAVSAMLNTSQKGYALVHSYNLVKAKSIVVGEELVAPFEEVREELAIKKGGIYYFADQNTLTDPGTAPRDYINLATAMKDSPTNTPDTIHNIYKDDPCYYIYTSGTTGLSKAVKFTHGRLIMAYLGFGVASTNLTKTDVIYSTLPLYHSTAMVICWGPALVSGAGFAIRRKFSASNFLDDIRKYNATCFGYVGEICRYILNQPERPDDADNPLTKMVGTGLRPSIWKDFKKRFGISEVYEGYASSEGPVGFINFLNFDNTVGCSLPDSFAIVKFDKDSEMPVKNAEGWMEKVGRGGEGLLVTKISEKTPFDGYTEKDKTESSILRDVFEKGDAWFNTGDYLRDIGFKHAQFLDRLGDTYRWKGENVSTAEIENVICDYPGVAETVVFGAKIPNTNGRAGMAIIIQIDPKQSFEYTQLYAHLKKDLPAYAIPIFIRIQERAETTGTFKYKKTKVKNEGFDISQFKDPVYVWLPGSDTYVPLTPEIYESICNGKYQY